MQWNLLATGLHTDGFVKRSDFKNIEDLKQMMEFANSYKDWITDPSSPEVNQTVGEGVKTNVEWFVELQGFLNKLVFSDDFVKTGEQLCAGLASEEHGLEAFAETTEAVLFRPNEDDPAELDVKALVDAAGRFAEMFAKTPLYFAREAFETDFKDTVKGMMAKRLLLPMQEHAKKGVRLDPEAYKPLKYVVQGLRWYRDVLCGKDILNSLRVAYRTAVESDKPAARNELTVAAIKKYRPDILTAQEVAPDQYVLIAAAMGHGELPRDVPKIKSVADLPAELTSSHAEWRTLRPIVWKKNGPAVMGSGVFVNPEKFVITHVKEVEDPAAAAPKKEGDKREGLGVLVKVEPKGAEKRPFCVFSAHLKSGNDEEKDGKKRKEQLATMQKTVGDSEECRGLELIIGMDGNYDRTLAEHSEKGAAEYWNKYLPTTPESQIYFQSYLDLAKMNHLNEDELLVSCNKMRGLFSAQVKKWGEYQLRNIDYVLLKKHPALAPTLAFENLVNIGRGEDLDLQKYPKSWLQEMTEETPVEGIIKFLGNHPRAMEGLMPNTTKRQPSDHSPVVVDFTYV